MLVAKLDRMWFKFGTITWVASEKKEEEESYPISTGQETIVAVREYVMPRLHGYRDTTAMYIRRAKYAHIYTLSINTGKNQSMKVHGIYTF